MLFDQLTSVPSANVQASSANTSLYVWGDNGSAQLGIPNNYNYAGPYSWKSVYTTATDAANSPAVFATDNINRLWAWGYNDYGQFGNGTTIGTMIYGGGAISTGISNMSVVAPGTSWTMGIDTLGRLFTWGSNSSGTLGDGTTLSRSSPVQVGTSSWSKISSGTSHSMAIDSVGRLFTWGLGTSGQLGSGAPSSRSSPVQVGTSSWLFVNAGNNWSFAIDIDGRLFAWGTNTGSFSGVLGDGTTVSKSSPVQIGTSSWSMTTSTFNSCAAIDSVGRLFTWGVGTSGQLGDGTTVSKSSPVLIGTSSWSFISMGYQCGMGLTSDQRLFTWGSGTNGSLGQNDTSVPRSSPTLVGTSSWTIAKYSGFGAGSAIDINGRLFTWGYGPLADGIAYGTSVFTSSPTLASVQASVLEINPTTNILAVSSFLNNNSFSQIVPGNNHTLAIATDGSLWAWGGNNLGQLGNGSTINYVSPVKIGTSSWTSIGVSDDTSCAIDISGRLFAWGNNAVYQIGDGTSINKSSPVLLSTENYISLTTLTNVSWTAISAGTSHSMAIAKDGSLWTTGAGASGAQGTGTTVNRSFPGQVGIYNYSWSKVASSAKHTMAIKSDGTLWGWGGNATGQLGDLTVVAKSTPVQIGTSSWSVISAGDATGTALNSAASLGIDSLGRLFAWGNNVAGTLGDGTTVNKSSPVQIGTSSWAFVDISVNSNSSYMSAIGIDSVGRLFTWGAGEFGTLGHGSVDNFSSPVQVGSISPTYDSWKAVASGDGFSVAIYGGTTRNGGLWSTGQNGVGQLGNGTTIQKLKFAENWPSGTTSWTSLAAGTSHVLGLATDGRLFTWGVNSSGQIGDGTTINKSSPVLIGTSSWAFVSARGLNSAAIDSVGRLFTWGPNASGQLGDGTTINKSSPVLIGTSSWSVVSAGLNNTVAIDSVGRLFVWGLNSSGQIGDGTTVSASSPVLIGTSSWSKVASLVSVTAAITTDGKLFTWGLAGNGALGNNSLTANRSSPVQLGTSSWSMVAAGTSYAIAAIDSVGRLFTWGSGISNNYNLGTLAPGAYTVTGTSSPVQVASSASFSMVAVGYSHMMAIRSTVGSVGQLFGWGSGGSGNYGANGFDLQSSQLGYPVQVNTSYTVSSVSTSWTIASMTKTAFAIDSNGRLFSWGANNTGQLGDGTTITKYSPTQVGTSSWSKVASGMSNTLAIDSVGRLFTWGYGNPAGAIGDGTTISKSSPVLLGTSSWSAVSIKESFGMAVDSVGRLFTWGNAGFGELGDGTVTAKSSPVVISTLNSATVISSLSSPESFTLISSGYGNILFAVGKSPTYNVYAWGSSVGISNFDVLYPTALLNQNNIFANKFSPFVSVSSDGSHVAAIRSDGSMWTIGQSQNNSGAAGNGSTLPISSPVQIGTSSWVATSSGYFTGYGIDANGRLFSWGQADLGQLGDSTTVAKSSPVQVGTSSWSLISSGYQWTAAIDSVGRLFAWGSNSQGQLGDGTTVNKSSPVQVGTSSWASVASGLSHTVAIDSVGRLFAWGLNSGGQIGDGTTINKSSPVQIGTSSWSVVNASTSNCYAIDSVGRLFTWGTNGAGQIGDGTTISKSSPVLIGTSSWLFLGASFGGNGILAIDINKRLFGWGSGSTGSIGDGTTLSRSSPLLVGTSSWSMVKTAAGTNSIGITIDGRLFTWGYAASYNLGDGTSVNRSYPGQIGSYLAFNLGLNGQYISKILTTGSGAGIFLDQVPSVLTIGNNTNGELGLYANTTSQSVYTRILQ